MIGLFWSERAEPGTEVRLGDDAAQHVRVRRLERGESVRLLDGKGRVAVGSLADIGKKDVTVSVVNVVEVARPTPLEAIVPVADKERMLLAAEKCVELQITAWKPVYFARSHSVASRGEGERFHEKVRARMRAALEQSGGAWMPEIATENEQSVVLAAVPSGWNRFLLDAEGRPLASMVTSGPTALVVGPEGGFERSEKEAAIAGGWVPAGLAASTLRFETAVIAGAAVIRATQLTLGGS